MYRRRGKLSITPHSPFHVPDRYFDKYKARRLDDTLACVYGMVE